MISPLQVPLIFLLNSFFLCVLAAWDSLETNLIKLKGYVLYDMGKLPDPKDNDDCPRKIGNLVNDFPQCLISIQNLRHIDMESTEVKVPVLQSRVAIAGFYHPNKYESYRTEFVWYSGKPSNETTVRDIVHQDGLYMKTKWNCEINVLLCAGYTHTYPGLYLGRKNIGETLHVPLGTFFEGDAEYPILFPELKVTMPTIWFHVLIIGKKPKKNEDRIVRDYVRGMVEIFVETNRTSESQFYGLVDLKKLVPFEFGTRKMSIQEIKTIIHRNSLQTINVENQRYIIKGEVTLSNDGVFTVTKTDHTEPGKQMWRLATTINNHKLIHYLRPSVVDSIESFVSAVLLHAITPNVTKVFDIPKRTWAPRVKVQTGETNGQLSLVTSVEEFRFISCGRPSLTGINFKIYVSPFDGTTWSMLLAINVIVSVMISMKVSGSISDGLLRGFVLLMEQGDSAVLNRKRIPFLYWICGPWILITLIMTNAYRGENITKLLAPFKPIPYANASQLAQDNFNILSKQVNFKGPNYDYGAMFYRVTRSELAMLMSGMKFWNKEYSPQWKEAVKLFVNKTMFGSNFDEALLDRLSACNQDAYFGWTSEYRKLYEFISHKHPEFKDKKLYIGKEIFAVQNVGWELDHFYDESIYLKLSVLTESGIKLRYDDLIWTANRFHTLANLNQSRSGPTPAQPISIKGNIYTIFLLVGGISVVVCAFFTSELICHFFMTRLWAVIFLRLVKGFLGSEL